MKILFAFLVCCVAIGFAQENTAAQSNAPSTSPQTVTVPPAEMLGLVEYKVLPQYPKSALMKGTQGNVVFKILVDENGKIIRSDLVSGDPSLVAASEEAMRNYRFRPYVVNGSPVRVASELGFRFTATSNGGAAHGEVECMSTIP